MAKSVRSRRKSPAGRLLLIGAVLGVLYFARGYFRPAAEKQYPPNAFFEVKRGDLLISVVEEGALRAVNETIIRNSLEGTSRILTLVPEGTAVKKGELLVELDSSELRDRLSEQDVAYQDNLFMFLQAQENLKIQKSLIESRIKDGELAVELSQTDLEKYRDGDVPKQVKAGQSQIAVIQEQVRIARERFTRTQELHQGANATKTELEADSLTLKRQELGLAQSLEDLRLLTQYDQPNAIRQLQSNLQQAKDELERLKQRSAAEIAQAEADLKTSQRALEVMDETLKLQRTQLENAKIFAPQDGLVVYASANPFQSRGEGGGGGRGRRREGGAESMFGSEGQNRRDGGGGGGGGRSRSRSGSSGSSSGSGGQSIASGAGAGSGASSAATAATTTTGSGGGSGLGGGGQGSEGASYASFRSVRQSTSFASSGSSSAGSSLSSGSSSSFGSSYASSAQSSLYGSSSSQLGSRFGTQGAMDLGSFGFTSWSTVIEEGATVRQRQELIKLPDVSRMLAEIKIQESRVRQVHPGMLAYVRVETLPGRNFKGSVRKVGLLPDAQSSWMNPDLKVYATEVLIDDELPQLKPGVSARAEIIITNLAKVLSVPIQTVIPIKGERVCFVKRGPSISRVPVTTGWFNDRFIEVTSGLKEGDRVLLAPDVEPDEMDAESADGQTNQVSTSESETPPSRPVEPSPTENPTVAPGRDLPDSPALTPPSAPGSRGERGFGRGDRPGTEAGPGSEGRGQRRGRRGDPAEMQRLQEEFMKLTPEEREARMREFQSRGRGGRGRGQTNSGPANPPPTPEP